MNFVRIYRDGIFIVASIYHKKWSEEMLSNTMTLVEQKRFLLKVSAKRWVNLTMCNDLIKNNRLEIVNE